MVDVREARSKSEQIPRRRRETGRRCLIAKEAAAEVPVQRGRFGVKIGDDQIGKTVAVIVAKGDAHARLIAPFRPGGNARRVTDFLEPEPAKIAEQIIRGSIVGDVNVDLAIVVEVGRDDAETSAVGIGESGFFRDIDEVAAVVAEDVVGGAFDFARVAREIASLVVRANHEMSVVPDHVMTNIQVEVAVSIQVGERRRSRVVAAAGQPGVLGHVGKGAVAVVAVQRIRAQAADKHVGATVAVVVANGHAQAVVAGEGRDPGDVSHIAKRAVAFVVEETVTVRHRRGGRIVQDRTALNDINIKPTVAVVVEHADAAGHRLRQVVERGFAVAKRERQAGGFGVVGELRERAGQRGGGGGDHARLGARRQSDGGQIVPKRRGVRGFRG